MKPPDSILMMWVFVFWEADNAAAQQIGSISELEMKESL
jgi:hypothetical protein